MSERQHFPSPPDAGIFNALRFVRSTLRFLDAIQSRYRDGAELSVPGGPSIVFITEPGLYHEAMGRLDDFSRVAANGAAALIAGFGGGPLERYVEGMADQAVRLREEWAEAVAAGNADRTLHRDMTTVTVRAATEALFGTDIGTEPGRNHDSTGPPGRKMERNTHGGAGGTTVQAMTR